MPTPGGFARRLAAGCVLVAALSLPGAATFANPSTDPSADPSTGPLAAVPLPVPPPVPQPTADAESAAAARGRAPGLHPDPPAHPSPPPGVPGPVKPAPVTDPPTQAEWERLIDRLAAHGARPLTDESGEAVVDVDDRLVLTGAPEGLAELRSWGAEITPEEKPDVYAVRSGGRIVARYLVEHAPAGSPASATPLTTPALDAPPALPRTGPSVVNLTLIALGGAGIVCAGGLLVRCSPPTRRR